MIDSPSALMTPADLWAHIDAPDDRQPLAVLDASYRMGVGGNPPELAFQQLRIGQAGFFDIDAVADPESPFPHSLPSAQDFATAVSALGISNAHKVVIYDQTGIAMAAARAWWMFRVFGHDNVFVLDGGLPAWINSQFPLEHKPQETPAVQRFSASLRPHLVATYEDMKKYSARDDALILDARPSLAQGSIPRAVHYPAGRLIDPQTGGLMSVKALGGELPQDRSKRIVASCNSGVVACVTALHLHEQGYDNYAVYDGSWTEWSHEELTS